jgi:hypothetical protein
MNILKSLKGWLVDVFGFIPRKDYDFVQRRRWQAEDYNRVLIETQSALYDSIYSRKFKSFEMLADVPLETIQTNDVLVNDVRLTWSVRIPQMRFVTCYDINKEIEDVKRYVITRLSAAFAEHISKQIFKQ